MPDASASERDLTDSVPSPHPVPAWLHRRLLVVAGKGGVGRSTVAAALALTAASEGKRVLAVDVVADGGLERALSGSSRAKHGIEVARLSTEDSLDEYVKLYLRLPISPTRIGPIAAIFDYVATAAPGVREILTIGKIANDVRNGPWDLVVVDGPATGHTVELLSAAQTLRDLIGFGPLVDQTAWIADILSDPDQTGVVTVTLAEELPVSETVELLDRLRAETEVAPLGLVVNRLPVLLTEAGESELVALASQPDGLGTAAAVAVNRSRAALDQLETLAVLGAEFGIETLQVSASDEPVDAAAVVMGLIG